METGCCHNSGLFRITRSFRSIRTTRSTRSTRITLTTRIIQTTQTILPNPFMLIIHRICALSAQRYKIPSPLAFQGSFLFRLKGSMIFRYEGSTQLAIEGQTHAAFPVTTEYCYLHFVLCSWGQWMHKFSTHHCSHGKTVAAAEAARVARVQIELEVPRVVREALANRGQPIVTVVACAAEIAIVAIARSGEEK